MKRLRLLLAMITAGLVLASQAAAAFACGDCGPGQAMTAAHAVTAKYQSLSLAKKAGYAILADTAGITCIDEPQMGAMGAHNVAMGVHYVKGDLVKDPGVDPLHPEALVYASDRHGRLH